MRTQILPMWMAVMSTMASCASGTYPSVGGLEMRVPQERRVGLHCPTARLLLHRWRWSLRGGSQPQISIGSQISLISSSLLRYEGKLLEVDQGQGTVTLLEVCCFGDEGRRPWGQEVPPNPGIYEKIVFRGQDIKDLKVLSGTSSTYPVPDPMCGQSSLQAPVAADASSIGMPTQRPQQPRWSPSIEQVHAARGGLKQATSREALTSRSTRSTSTARSASNHVTPRGTGRGVRGAGNRGERVVRRHSPTFGGELEQNPGTG